MYFSIWQGDRLSHAVGCAFAICLEKKQKRDQECAVSMNFDKNDSTFTRIGSFRQATITERLADPQVCIYTMYLISLLSHTTRKGNSRSVQYLLLRSRPPKLPFS